ncbi:hypothetical protein WJX73_005592 [Symbiochloris irregularis]|uniref:Endo-polygalacturonase n=1 Tax=Symbiochloris irregularis TaxID=706552 RepID=A0AAW1NL82_9CHLO
MFQCNRTYLTATIVLSGSVNVYLPADSSIIAGTQREDFGSVQADWYLLRFDRCKNCSVSGGGTLDMRGRLWVTGLVPGRWMKTVRNFQDASCKNPNECRPRVLGVVNSVNVSIKDILLKDSIYWTLHIFGSQGVSVYNVTVDNDFEIPNDDGMDIDSSKDVWVSHCNVTAWDDGICLKATLPGVSTENVLVEESTVRSRASALKIGTESRADFTNLVFQHNKVIESHRGLSIQLRDNGSVSGVLFSDIKMSLQRYVGDEWGGSEPIYVTALPRNSTTHEGSISGITFQNISAITEAGILVVGMPDNPVTDLTVFNMEMNFQKLTNVPGGFHDLRPSDFANKSGVPDNQVFLQNVQNVSITALNVSELCGGAQKPTWGQTLNATLGIQNLTFQDTPLCPLTLVPCGCPAGKMSLEPIHIVDDKPVPAYSDAQQQMADVATHHWDLRGEIDLTLEQLAGKENGQLWKELKTPAARWTLARMSQSKHVWDYGTKINLKGHASCIAEGLTVPWFFTALADKDVPYAMDVDLHGYPTGCWDAEDGRLPISGHLERDMAALDQAMAEKHRQQGRPAVVELSNYTAAHSFETVDSEHI